MKTHWMIPFPLLLSAGLALASSPRPQEEPAQEQPQTREQRARESGDLVGTDELVFRRVRPQAMEARKAYELLRDLRGRNLWIAERGGLNAPPTQNVAWLDDSILLIDREEEVDAMVELVEQLDGLEEAPEGQALRSLEFQPRYLSLESLERALQPLLRMVPDPRNPRISAPNMASVPERSLLLLRDTEERVDEMLRLLTKLDVPPPQVRITVWVAESEELDEDDETPDAGGLPAELTKDLAALLPGFAFESDGYSVVQTSVAPGRAVELEIDGGIETYSLLLRPQAYDVDTGNLTLSSCEFVKSWRPRPPSNATNSIQQMATRSSQLFSTSAVLRAGEYTVLGASGREPVFLVVRVERLSLR